MAELKFERGYPEYMLESIELVKKTRPHRMGQQFQKMTLKERDDVLRLHPDYAPGGKRTLNVGVNSGDIAPIEVADLLESRPLVEPGEVDLGAPDYDVDILIVGGGLAGTLAAIFADDEGVETDRILLATKLRHGDSNSMMAQGGTQAADRPEDSPLIHYIDCLGGGHFTNKPELVRALTQDAPLVVKWLKDNGAMWDLQEDGTFLELSGGGTSKRRLHSCKDYTGMEEMRVARDEFRNRGIPALEFSPLVELLTDGEGSVAGGILWNMETEGYTIVRAKSTLLATGGFGRLHIRGFPTTNHYGATADGLVVAYRAGAKLIDLDTVQYHPTGAAYPPQIVGLLITEKLRGLGAQPVNKDGEQFVFPLEPRDVEASAFIRECYVRGGGVTTPTGIKGVWLDSPLIDELHGEGTIEGALPAMVRMYKRFGIDMTCDPVLVFPTLHYQNGGIEINDRCETSVPGLFASGEVEGGVHGKNRLMGNSTLDCLVFGRRGGIYAASYAKKRQKPAKLTLDHVRGYSKALKGAGIKTARKAPILLPDYRGKGALARMIDVLE